MNKNKSESKGNLENEGVEANRGRRFRENGSAHQ